MSIPVVPSLASIAAPYALLLVDIWGVVHNGLRAYPAALAALVAARRRGAKVILISNAPRRSSEIPAQFARLGVPRESYDAIVTSGDASRALIAKWAKEGARRLHHIGPDRDLSLFEGLNVERVAPAEATRVVCTGLFDDETEKPEDYDRALHEIARAGLPFLCANPDELVQRGDKLVYCAGALAKRLIALGGSAVYTGKPHAKIYELAMAEAARLIGRTPAKAEVLAIGDGLFTDILGAERFGTASLFIAGGVHGATMQGMGRIDHGAVEQACAEAGVHPVGVMSGLA